MIRTPGRAAIARRRAIPPRLAPGRRRRARMEIPAPDGEGPTWHGPTGRQAAEAADRLRPATARADPHWPRSIWEGVQGEATGRRRVSRAARATGLPTISSGRPAPAMRLPPAVGATVARGAGRRATPASATDSRDRRARASSPWVRPRGRSGRVGPARWRDRRSGSSRGDRAVLRIIAGRRPGSRAGRVRAAGTKRVRASAMAIHYRTSNRCRTVPCRRSDH